MKYNFQNLLLKNGLIKNNKKVRKLVNNPNLFFYDFFKKRIDYSPAIPHEKTDTINNIISSSTLKEKKIDYKYNTKNICLAIVEELALKTQLVFCHEFNKSGEFKIICNTDQIKNVHEIIINFEYKDLKVFSNQNKIIPLQKNCVEYAFYNEDTVFLNTIIILEPWFKNNTHIFTYNKNNLLTHLEKRYLNKSVYSSHPVVLQGEYKTPYLEKNLDLKKNSFNNYHFPIDVVITWVNGNDPEWIEKKRAFTPLNFGNSENDSVSRYDQIDEIKYSLRSIERNLKFVRNIFLVTDDQHPWWLNLENKKVQIISHKDFIDEQYLPTFNSHVIESYLHKIPNLSENFIYMNDDCFIWKQLDASDFFSPGGISFSRFEPIKNVYGIRPDPTSPGWKNAAINSNNLLNEINLAKGVSFHLHTPFALKKSILFDLEEKFKKEYSAFRVNKTRELNDISTVSFLYHHYAIQNGKAMIYNEPQSLNVNSSNKNSLNNLFSNSSPYDNKYNFICINDGGDSKFSTLVLEILNKKFPEKSDWEI